MEKSLERSFLFVSLAAASVVALLYVLGAVALAAQLHQANVDPMDGVGLFSVSQILVKGVAVVVTPAALLVLAMVMAAFFVFFHPGLPGPEYPKRPPRHTRRIQWASLGVCLGLLAAGIAFASPTRRAIFLPMAAFLGVYGWVLWKHTLWGQRRLIGSALVVAFGASLLIGAWMNPRPLPQAWLYIRGQPEARKRGEKIFGKFVEGRLIGVDGGIWYLHSGGVTLGVPVERTAKIEIFPSP